MRCRRAFLCLVALGFTRTVAGQTAAASLGEGLRGVPSFDRFLPGACVYAPFPITQWLTWSGLDTLAYHPTQDTLGVGIRDSLRLCAQRYATGPLPILEQLNVARVQLLVGNDSAAQATAQRYLRSLHDTGAPRAWAHYLIVKDLLAAQPARLATARTVLAALDRLPVPTAAKAQLLAHAAMAETARRQWDDTAALTEQQAAIDAWRHLPDSTWRTAFAGIIAEVYRQRADIAVRQHGGPAARAVLDTAGRTLRPTFFEHQRRLYAMVDQPADSIAARFWYPDGGLMRGVRPRLGVVTVVTEVEAFCGLPCRRYNSAMHRLLTRFSGRVDVINTARIGGFFADTAPVPPVVEAQHDSAYFLGQLGLAGELAIAETRYTWMPAPDGRRRNEPTPQEEHYGRRHVVIVDQRGRIRYVRDGWDPVMEEPLARFVTALLQE